MTTINITEAIKATLNRLNRDAGGDAECYTVETENGAALFVKSWSGSKDIGMVSVYHESADDAADVLGLDSDLFYAWVTGDDGYPTLASFESSDERGMWLAQV